MLVVLIVLMLAANHIFVEIVDLVWLDTHANFLLYGSQALLQAPAFSFSNVEDFLRTFK